MNTNQKDNGTEQTQVSGHYPVIIIGGGQAGLSMSYCLKERGVDHLIFEKNRLGESWRSKRWDSFCLVTPNWQCQLPGFPYSGNDPDGFMKKDEIVALHRSLRTIFPAADSGRGQLLRGYPRTRLADLLWRLASAIIWQIKWW